MRDLAKEQADQAAHGQRAYSIEQVLAVAF